MRSLRAQLRRAAPHFRIALITGEEGTGREVVALALHRLTSESDATFHSHTAASMLALMPEILARVEGTDRDGAMLSAWPATPLIEAQSTLFLSEVGDLTFGEQMYLRHSLQRITEAKNKGERPRMIFATERNLCSLSGAGFFDRGLYRAISAVEILLPPVRARPEDIPLITCAMLSRSSGSGDTASGAFDGRALSCLQCHDWPGNVRELEHVVDLARQSAGDRIIEALHLPPLGEFARAHHKRKLDHHIDRLEDVIQNHVLDVLVRCSGNKVRAAERLGISRSTLYRMLDASAADRAS
jgi:DNA-binding NtrC family response regulator